MYTTRMCYKQKGTRKKLTDGRRLWRQCVRKHVAAEKVLHGRTLEKTLPNYHLQLTAQAHATRASIPLVLSATEVHPGQLLYLSILPIGWKYESRCHVTRQLPMYACSLFHLHWDTIHNPNRSPTIRWPLPGNRSRVPLNREKQTSANLITPREKKNKSFTFLVVTHTPATQLAMSSVFDFATFGPALHAALCAIVPQLAQKQQRFFCS